ncbi:MAG: hypothetical protein KC496_14540, partial [Anaerolineae bacterium]|nr:hypothetical protein [Anaerolineae bacterium]
STPAVDSFFIFGSSGIPVANYRGGMSGLSALSMPPVAEPTVTATASATATQLPPSATATTVLTEPATPTQLPSPTATATPSPTATATLLPSATATLPATATPLPTQPAAEQTAEVTQEAQ